MVNVKLSIAQHRRPTKNIQGFRGVYWDAEHDRWRAEIVFRRRRYKLGRHHSPESAAYSYDNAARRFYGAAAMTNFNILSPAFKDELDKEGLLPDG